MITQGGLAYGVSKLGNEITKAIQSHVISKKNESKNEVLLC